MEHNESSKRLMLLGSWGYSGSPDPRQEMNHLLKMQQIKKKKKKKFQLLLIIFSLRRNILYWGCAYLRHPHESTIPPPGKAAELITACTEMLRSSPETGSLLTLKLFRAAGICQLGKLRHRGADTPEASTEQRGESRNSDIQAISSELQILQSCY